LLTLAGILTIFLRILPGFSGILPGFSTNQNFWVALAPLNPCLLYITALKLVVLLFSEWTKQGSHTIFKTKFHDIP